MVEYLAPKKVCPTWYYILSHLAFEWKNGNETVLHSDKQSNPWAVWVERSIDEQFGVYGSASIVD